MVVSPLGYADVRSKTAVRPNHHCRCLYLDGTHLVPYAPLLSDRCDGLPILSSCCKRMTTVLKRLNSDAVILGLESLFPCFRLHET